MSRLAYDIVLHPLFTEKSSLQKESQKVSFVVATDANKVEIRDAVQKLFNVKVLSVHTQIVRGKVKRFGRGMGKRSNWKKAIITLKDGDNIEFFEAE